MPTFDRLDEAMQSVESEDTIVARAAGVAVGVIATAMANDAELDAMDSGDDIPPAAQFYSVGWCCQRFQLMPYGIRHSMKLANVKFAKSENGVPYLDGFGLIALAKCLKSLRAKQGDKE